MVYARDVMGDMAASGRDWDAAQRNDSEQQRGQTMGEFVTKVQAGINEPRIDSAERAELVTVMTELAEMAGGLAKILTISNADDPEFDRGSIAAMVAIMGVRLESLADDLIDNGQ